jgi:F0F1-type ATP synthase assembly protein I
MNHKQGDDGIDVTGSAHRHLTETVAADRASGLFFGAIMAGMLIGLGLDAWLDTEPWLVVIGIIAGSATGFWRMWVISQEEDARG